MLGLSQCVASQHLHTIVERVGFVNYCWKRAWSFLAAGIEPLQGTREEDIEGLISHSLRVARPDGLRRFARRQSPLDVPSGLAAPPRSLCCPYCWHDGQTIGDSATFGASLCAHVSACQPDSFPQPTARASFSICSTDFIHRRSTMCHM